MRQNIEHPHSLVILSSFFFLLLLLMHFSFIGKTQFRRAMLFCDSSFMNVSLKYLNLQPRNVLFSSYQRRQRPNAWRKMTSNIGFSDMCSLPGQARLGA